MVGSFRTSIVANTVIFALYSLLHSLHLLHRVVFSPHCLPSLTVRVRLQKLANQILVFLLNDYDLLIAYHSLANAELYALFETLNFAVHVLDTFKSQFYTRIKKCQGHEEQNSRIPCNIVYSISTFFH